MVVLDKKIVSVRLVEDSKAEQNTTNLQTEDENKPIERGEVTKGYTLKIKYSDSSYYFTLNFNKDNSLVEVFINSSSTSPNTNAFIQTLARMVSNQLKHRVSLESIIKHLDGIDSGESFLVKFPGKEKSKFIKSFSDLLSKVLQYYSDEKYLRKLFKENQKDEVELVIVQQQEKKETGLLTCPSCGEQTAKVEEGCLTCLSCGYSKCG